MKLLNEDVRTSEEVASMEESVIAPRSHRIALKECVKTAEKYVDFTQKASSL